MIFILLQKIIYLIFKTVLIQMMTWKLLLNGDSDVTQISYLVKMRAKMII